MDEQLSFLGLARRAGKLAAGEDAVQDALQAGKARLLILAADAGEKTVRWAEHRSQGRLPIAYLTSSREDLGHALGWGRCAVAAFTDLGMATAYAGKLARADARHAAVLEALEEKSCAIAARRAAKPRRRHER